eukprot:CAMPEP_0197610220 /NCGR_PEP_ID=MMETSP1326-20131121/52834_1 /TAXON_ID=1155430 /ORGANISM="Genus nov. species nov., Strain RCC2288" /LENGTH=102 /DNA_ID=CAMNT_0043178713 /DNA_START=3 /DNA_END=307 /DNA_ORIENTATION=+
MTFGAAVNDAEDDAAAAAAFDATAAAAGNAAGNAAIFPAFAIANDATRDEHLTPRGGNSVSRVLFAARLEESLGGWIPSPGVKPTKANTESWYEGQWRADRP